VVAAFFAGTVGGAYALVAFGFGCLMLPIAVLLGLMIWERGRES
jgi:uncharacterized iron-regulated membrane protein